VKKPCGPTTNPPLPQKVFYSPIMAVIKAQTMPEPFHKKADVNSLCSSFLGSPLLPQNCFARQPTGAAWPS
jgi:hypothetical protein